jgi:hypothetical protein
MITAIMSRGIGPHNKALMEELLRDPLIRKIVVLDSGRGCSLPPRCEALACDNPFSSATLNALFSRISTSYALIFSFANMRSDPWAPRRLLAVAEETGAAMVYADYAEMQGGLLREHPVNDYQQGSIRDGFDFGPLILVSKAAVRRAFRKYGVTPPYQWAGFYDLRLKVSTDHELFHLPERLSMVTEAARDAGLFAYVDPKNRAIQEEMEAAATAHLKRIGAWLAPVFRDVPPSDYPFPTEASVVIPVRNRARTVADAVKSALAQKTDFPFNVIVVDNHSTDGTTAILADLAKQHFALKHLIPARCDLSIGGCWNEAAFSDACGRFAIQLDSDDLYSGEDVLQLLVDVLRKENCAMAVGSYTIVDGNLREIPPGLIDHREWTEAMRCGSTASARRGPSTRRFSARQDSRTSATARITPLLCASVVNIGSGGSTILSISAAAGRGTPMRPSPWSRRTATTPTRTDSEPSKFARAGR